MTSVDKKKLEEILRLIPGYDPFATAGDCVLDHVEAQNAIDFFPECLVHIEGTLANKPFVLEPWQQAVIGNLFGWKRPDGSRRYREGLVFVARKNGKSPLAAGIALKVLFGDEEVGQQNYMAAADREQAGKLFRYAKLMRDKNEIMAARSRAYGGHAEAGQSRSIVLEDDASFLRVIAADANVQHGGTSHLVEIDELHAQPNRDLVDVLITSTASANRRNPLILYFTTSDFEREGSICNEKYDYACKVRDGVIDDPAFLPVIYEAKNDDDWRSPETWKKANPNLGVSVSLEYLERECKRAQETPAYQNTFKRLHLNIRTAQDTLWLDVMRWKALAQPVDWQEFHGAECCGAFDLASKLDLTAWALVFVRNGKYYVRSHFWMPKESVRRKKSSRLNADLLAWAEQGHITLTDGETTDYAFVVQHIANEASLFQIMDIGFDPWNATATATTLANDHQLELVEYGQRYSTLNEPAKELERLIVAGDIVHDGNPVMTWCVSNCMVATDPSGNIRPVKPQHLEENKVDGVIAMTMALGRGMQRLQREHETLAFI